MVAEWVLDPDAALMMQVLRRATSRVSKRCCERNRAPVVNHLYRLVHNRAIAEELAQDVFLRVYRFRDRYQPEAKFTTWLFRITTNVALNWRRDTRREQSDVRSGRKPPNARKIEVRRIKPRAPIRAACRDHARARSATRSESPASQATRRGSDAQVRRLGLLGHRRGAGLLDPGAEVAAVPRLRDAAAPAAHFDPEQETA